MRHAVHEHSNTRWGAAAVARSGDLTIELDEALDGPDAWRLRVESPRLYLSFGLDTLGSLRLALSFLRRDPECAECEELALGPQPSQSLKIFRDDEDKGRYFFLFAGAEHLARITIDPDSARHLTTALEDLIDQFAGA
jgi:hypothetical protein